MPQVKSPDLQVNVPIDAPAPDSSLIVLVDPAAPMRVGTYVFQLIVTDDSNNASQPAIVKMVVVDDKAPNAVIDAPERVPFATGFTLSGKRSFDIGGTIARFSWTLLQGP